MIKRVSNLRFLQFQCLSNLLLSKQRSKAYEITACASFGGVAYRRASKDASNLLQRIDREQQMPRLSNSQCSDSSLSAPRQQLVKILMINTHKKEGQKKWHRQDENNYHEVEEDAFNL